jgi:hypothetical protein
VLDVGTPAQRVAALTLVARLAAERPELRSALAQAIAPHVNSLVQIAIDMDPATGTNPLDGVVTILTYLGPDRSC